MYKVVCVKRNGQRVSCIHKEHAPSFMLKYSTKTKTTAAPGTKLLVFEKLGHAMAFASDEYKFWETKRIEIWKVKWWGKKDTNISICSCSCDKKIMLRCWKEGGGEHFPVGTVGVKTVKLSEMIKGSTFLHIERE